MGMRRCAWGMCVRRFHGICGHTVLVLFARLVLMLRLPILDLGLEHPGRNAGRVLEHESAAEHAGPHQAQKSHDAQHARERKLLRRHLETADETPGEYDGEE